MPLVIRLFIQQMFTECLLYVRGKMVIDTVHTLVDFTGDSYELGVPF